MSVTQSAPAQPAVVRMAPWAALLLILGIAAWADLQLGQLPINDDWGFTWEVAHWNWQHWAIYPGSSALAIPQVFLGRLLTSSHPDIRVLRLSELPFSVLMVVFVYKLSRLLGADHFWAAVAGVAMACCPVFTANQSTFMSDVPYLGLLALVTYAAARWILDGRRGWWLPPLCVLAAGQRQVGLVLPLAITCGYALAHWRRWRTGDLLVIGACWVISLGSYLLLIKLGVLPPTQGNRLAGAIAAPPLDRIEAFLYLPWMLGLALMPFGASLWKRGMRPDHRVSILILLAGILVFLWIARSGILAGTLTAGWLWPGDTFNPRTFGVEVGMIRARPWLAWPLIVLLELGSAAGAGALAWRYRDASRLGPAGTFLLLLSLINFLPLAALAYTPFDRYYLPSLLPLLPIAAALASKSKVMWPRLVAIAVLAADVGLFAAGEQLYVAWAVARDEAVQMAYAQVDYTRVDAIYEENAIHLELPCYDMYHVYLGNGADATRYDLSLDGPIDPLITIETSTPDDPRQGVSYTAFAGSGRLVLVYHQAPPGPIDVCDRSQYAVLDGTPP